MRYEYKMVVGGQSNWGDKPVSDLCAEGWEPIRLFEYNRFHELSLPMSIVVVLRRPVNTR